ncbi:hypothetical protein [Streptomyces sp. bgisy034]|uniref:hypothetical protein n=1 Tax=Streptomyces sp. bgisy034 TaxID=3413774 RepID=UPI003EB7C92D
MSVMSDLIERGAVPEGYKIEVFDGRVIMTPHSPEQDWTVSDVKDAVKTAGIARERVFGDVLITFPGENDAAPDLTVIGFDAERRKNSYFGVPVADDVQRVWVRSPRALRSGQKPWAVSHSASATRVRFESAGHSHSLMAATSTVAS